MKITRYEIDFAQAPNAQTAASRIEGALVEYEGGYGCLQPWPSLGDAPLEEQIEALQRGEPTAMGRACLRCCEVDGKARSEGRSLFSGLSVPPSHFLWAGGELPEGVTLVKVKSFDLLQNLPDGVTARLDLNACLDAEAFMRSVDALSDTVRERIDFVEDPTPYDAESWERISAQSGLRLALDRGPSDATRGFAVRVWKPACVPDPPAGELFCITHNMDHEIGRRWAAYRAATFGGRLVECGLGELSELDGVGLGWEPE